MSKTNNDSFSTGKYVNDVTFCNNYIIIAFFKDNKFVSRFTSYFIF